MKRAKLFYSSVARDEIRRLNPSVRTIIKAEIEGLMTDPYAGKELIEELKGFRSLVIGKYRVIYIFNEPSVIEVHFIGHRRDVYMNFRNLLERSRI